jgi:phosphohistidine swiveling domain-containing protein
MKLLKEQNQNKLWVKNIEGRSVPLNMILVWTYGGFEHQQRSVFLGEEFPLKEFILVMKGLDIEGCYLVESQIKEIINKIIKVIIEKPEHVKEIHRQTYILNDAYFEFCRNCINLNLSKIDDAELYKIIEQMLFFQHTSHMHSLCTSWLLDSNGATFSNYLINKTKKYIKRNNKNLDFAKAFSILTTPLKDSRTIIEEREFLNIAIKILNDRNSKSIFLSLNDFSKIPKNIPLKIKEEINCHFIKWRWMPFDYLGPAYDIDYYLKSLKEIITSNIDISAKIKVIDSRTLRLAKERKKIIYALKLSSEELEPYNIASDIIFLKGYRKECIFYGHYALSLIYKEISKRTDLAMNQIYMLTKHELEDMLFNGKEIDLNAINMKFKRNVLHYHKRKIKLYLAEDADLFLSKLDIKKEKVNLNNNTLSGTCASSGKAKGKIVIVNNNNDINKMYDGAIMLSHTTFPSMVPAMKKAAAIITEDGGITCHAAIVSREMGTPCITGVKHALDILSDGDEVEIDASNAIVKVINKK